MRKLMVIALLGLALLAFTAMLATAQEAAKEETKEAEKGAGHDSVGAEKCAKVCHKAQYTAWLETQHAKTFDVLSDEEKAKPECGGACHITAAGEGMENVQCEACHGPGGVQVTQDHEQVQVERRPGNLQEDGCRRRLDLSHRGDVCRVS